MEYCKGGLQKEFYTEEEVIKRQCPFCNSAGYTYIHKERGALGIVKCKYCKLIYTNPIVKEAEKNYWGDEKKYYEEARLIFNGLAKHHRDENYLQDLRIIEHMKPEGNFLDIGTNMGFFLRHTRGKTWNVFGIEPSPALSQMARKYFELNVKTAYLEDAGFKDDFFDIVTMTDVFEHIVNPKIMLLEIKKVLKKTAYYLLKSLTEIIIY